MSTILGPVAILGCLLVVGVVILVVALIVVSANKKNRAGGSRPGGRGGDGYVVPYYSDPGTAQSDHHGQSFGGDSGGSGWGGGDSGGWGGGGDSGGGGGGGDGGGGGTLEVVFGPPVLLRVARSAPRGVVGRPAYNTGTQDALRLAIHSTGPPLATNENQRQPLSPGRCGDRHNVVTDGLNPYHSMDSSGYA